MASVHGHDLSLDPAPLDGCRSLLAAAGVGAVALALYLYTLAPSILADDSGELVSAIHVLGVAHPTGYPLYLLVGKLFDLLPFGTPPVRIGIFSALSAAGAVGVIAWAGATLSRSAAAGALAGLVGALNTPMWDMATQPEVYALNALIIAGCAAVFIRWTETRNPQAVPWLALFVGLAVAHHRTALLFAVPLFAVAAVVSRPAGRLLVKAVGAGLAPLLFYLYVPIRAAAHPPVLWSDAATWHGFLRYVSGQTYQPYLFARPPAEMQTVARTIGAQLLSGLTPGGCALALIGLVSLLRRRVAVAAPLAFGAVVLTVWNLGYRVTDWTPFFIPVLLVAGLWIGEGLAVISRTLRAVATKQARWLPTAAACAMLLAVPAGMLQHNWGAAGHRSEWRDYDTARALFARLAPGSVFITNSDHGTFLPMYLQIVEGRRPDIVVSGSRRIYEPWSSDAATLSIIEDFRESWSHGPIYTPGQRGREALRFAAALAPAIHWRRPVYCLAYVTEAPVGLPSTALSLDLFEMVPEPPEMLVPASQGEPVADFAHGISLRRVAVEPPVVARRQRFRVVLDWQCGQPLAAPPAVLLSIARRDASGSIHRPQHLLTNFSTWFAYGLGPLPATPAGSAYRQQVTCLAPTGATAGQWLLLVGVSRDLEAPVDVTPVAAFAIAESADRALPGRPEDQAARSPAGRGRS